MFTGNGLCRYVDRKVFKELAEKTGADLKRLFKASGILEKTGNLFDIISDAFNLGALLTWDAMVAGVRIYGFFHKEA